MWTLLVLCSVLAIHGVQAADGKKSEDVLPKKPADPVAFSFAPGATSAAYETSDPRAEPCGGNMSATYDTFYSPNWPHNYLNYQFCEWYIRPDWPSRIMLNISIEDIECGYDYVAVYDGPSTGSPHLGSFCARESLVFHSTSPYLTVTFTSDGSVGRRGFKAEYIILDSCKNNCGNYLGNCSCSSSCRYWGECCPDYEEHCHSTSTYPPATTAQPSCRYNCGSHLGSCSCTSSCEYYGNCCPDYYSYCSSPTTSPEYTTTDHPSCRYNCGSHLGSCSCTSSCRYNGNCCPDYYSYCSAPTTPEYPTEETPTTAEPSCRHNCGWHLGSCSCDSNCERYGNCCYDYHSECSWTTEGTQTTPPPHTETTPHPSCYYNCGRDLGSCSCSSDCWYNGTCCYDYHPPLTCRYNCGRDLGSCSCSSDCWYNGTCCHDYHYYCDYPPPTEAPLTCRYNCGRDLGSCSCSSDCWYNGTCCHDYHYYCDHPPPTEAPLTCRYNCGRDLGSCSCSSDCWYNGTCCHDYRHYCSATSPPPTGSPCGGSLFGSGLFFSPNYPGYYNDNAYCVWQLRAAHGQRINLAFKYLQMENCCSCDYILVYNGPSTGYPLLGKVCGDTLASFYSTSTYLTVVFRSDGSVVGRGFTAEFMSALQLTSGRVNCTSDRMEIVMEKTYLDSLGYTAYNLSLNDPDCRPRTDRSQVVFSYPIGSCGNEREFINDRIEYTNVLRAFSGSDGEITRQSHLKLNISCIMDKNSISQNMYVVQHPGNSSITGAGRFDTSMTFYDSSSFYYPVTQFPYEVELNENLYVQVNLIGGDGSMVIFLDTCVASPSPSDFQTRPYYLVRNGCSADSSYASYTSGYNRYARFRFKAFQFLRATESVYLQCKVQICRQSDYSSRCRRGCMRRKARDLSAKHDSQTLVLGPIKLKEPKKKEEGSDEQNKA